MGLAALNLPVWFKTPLALHQIISWVLLFGSLFLALHGFALLRQALKQLTLLTVLIAALMTAMLYA